jgi:hypothetical protein
MRNKLFTTLSLAALLFAPTLCNAATKIDDPAKFVSSVYAKMAKSTDYSAPEDIYTPRLQSLFAIERKDSGGEVGRLDFDFWTNSQDWELKDIKVKEEPVELAKDREIVTAKFKNIGRPEEIHFYFEKTAAGWKLDDVRSAGHDAWVLSLILKYGWDSGN